MKKTLLLFLALFFLSGPVGIVRGEDPLLKIQVVLDQNSVDLGMMFLVNAEVINSSSDTSASFWVNSCSYEKHWVTDHAAVLIQSWACEDNAFEEITLAPGDTYQKDIILYVSRDSQAGSVTFRLGFNRMSENGDVAEPLWSDPVTMRVVISQEMESSVAALDSISLPVDLGPASTGMKDLSQALQTGSSATGTDQSLVFQDPGVPIKVKPGEEFSISLASNPSTGFLWKLSLPEGERIITFLKSEHLVSGEVMPGVPGQEVFTFRAVTPGEMTADFVYRRPWETVAAPERKIFTILVQER